MADIGPPGSTEVFLIVVCWSGRLADLLCLMPPYCPTPAELDRLYDAVSELAAEIALAAVSPKGRPIARRWLSLYGVDAPLPARRAGRACSSMVRADRS